jgi:hypothetical protein
MQSYHSTARAATVVAGRKYQKTLLGLMAATGAAGISYSILSTDKVNACSYKITPISTASSTESNQSLVYSDIISTLRRCHR